MHSPGNGGFQTFDVGDGKLLADAVSVEAYVDRPKRFFVPPDENPAGFAPVVGGRSCYLATAGAVNPEPQSAPAISPLATAGAAVEHGGPHARPRVSYEARGFQTVVLSRVVPRARRSVCGGRRRPGARRVTRSSRAGPSGLADPDDPDSELARLDRVFRRAWGRP